MKITVPTNYSEVIDYFKTGKLKLPILGQSSRSSVKITFLMGEISIKNSQIEGPAKKIIFLSSLTELEKGRKNNSNSFVCPYCNLGKVSPINAPIEVVIDYRQIAKVEEVHGGIRVHLNK